jgi:hypothetical protein
MLYCNGAKRVSSIAPPMVDVTARLSVMKQLLKVTLSPVMLDSSAVAFDEPRNELEPHKYAPNTMATLPP